MAPIPAIKLRAVDKTFCTKSCKDLDAELTAASPNRSRIQALIVTIETRLSSICSHNQTVIGELEGEALETEIEAQHSFEVEKRSAILKATQFLKDSANNQRTVISTDLSNNSNDQVKLPTLSLNKFDGSYLGWSPFWDSFQNAVHNRSDLPGSQKFIYLRNLLTADALHLVQNLSVDDKSYDVAVQLLTDTYGSKLRSIMHQVEAILALRVASGQNLMHFRASIESFLGSFKVLGYPIEGNSAFEAFFVSLILTKLPPGLKNNLMRAAGQDIIKLEKFRAVLKDEVELSSHDSSTKPIRANQHEGSLVKVRNSNLSHHGKPHHGLSENMPSTAGTFTVKVDQAQRSNNKVLQKRGKRVQYCQFCQAEGHTSYSCETYATLSARTNRLRSFGDRCEACLNWRHGHAPCPVLRCFVCKDSHWTALCPARESKLKPSSATVANIRVKNSVALPTLTVPIDVCGQVHYLRCMLDQCAQRTLVLKSTVDKLAISPIATESLIIEGYDNTISEKQYNIVTIDLISGADPIKVDAVVVDRLPRITSTGIETIASKLKHKNVRLADTRLTSSVIQDVALLLGNDIYFDIVRTDVLPRQVDGVWLVPTKFGECISGKLPSTSANSCSSNVVTVLKVGVEQTPWKGGMLPSEGDEDIQRIWLLDNIGLVDDGHTTTDETILKSFLENISYRDNMYTVKFPWKCYPPTLPNNFALAKGRLLSLLRKLDKNIPLRESYQKVIMEQLAKGFIEEVPPNQILNKVSHYLPHHPVEKLNSTTPLRIVMDCSARIKGCNSLNDCLYVGPTLVPLLLQILLRVRVQRFICAGDISKAFLRVGLHERDQDFTRFLWRRDYDDPSSPLITFRFKVVLFGSASSPFLLQATVQHHLDKFRKNNLSRNLYVDNLHGCFDSEEELVSFYKDSLEIFGVAGLPICEWVSNSPVLNQVIKRDNLGQNTVLDEVKMLGIIWNREEDTLRVANTSFPSPGEATKRSVLRCAAKIYDPLGLITPVSILTRVFLQKLWRQKRDWDEVVSEPLQVEWDMIVRKLEHLKQLTTPRWIAKSKTISLHVFSDASKDIYGCCAYLVSESDSDLLMAKARVAPIKELTIPKLELTAALIAARVIVFILDTFKLEIKFESVHLWIDSQVTLAWITAESEQKNLYVRNRVREIKNKIPDTIFHHISGESNPADIITKIGSLDLANSSNWWHGPEWLQNREHWVPWNNSTSVQQSTECTLIHPVAANIMPLPYSKCLPDPTRFSKWTKLSRATGYCMRFIDHISKKTNNTGPLSATEISTAENKWITELQGNWFSRELEYLKDPTSLSPGEKPPQLVQNLWLVIHDGILRVNTRLQFSIYSYEERYPALLPHKDYVTELIIMDTHEKLVHGSTSSTVAALRTKFWIPKCRQRVKSILSKCCFCKRYKLCRYSIPHTPPLPSFRVEESRPFQYTGVDYSGALHVKANNQVKKVYLVLFTCASTRAVHLDLAEDSSAYGFAKVYRRFVARRSSPQLMLSDNAKNFTGFMPQLQEFQNDPSVAHLLSQSRTTWKFIPARAPWFGGMWERLVGFSKTILKKALGKQLLTYDELLTIVTEVEGRVNDRPLTYTSTDESDLSAITPSRLLHGHRIDSLPIISGDLDLEEDYNFADPSNICKRHRKVLTMIKQSWCLWKREYILALRERDRKVKPVNTDGDILAQEGDVCLVVDNCPNSKFKLARIMRLIKGADDQVRAAEIKTESGISTRPLSKLCHLESVKVDQPVLSPRPEMAGPSADLGLQLRVPRRTASEARSKIIGWAHGGLV